MQPPAGPNTRDGRLRTGRRVAAISVAGSAVLAATNIVAGLLARSTSVVAAGVEFAGDVLASLIVLVAMLVASRPPDANHPYGHGRFEILGGFLVGLILLAGGAGICAVSLQRVGEIHPPPASFAIWPLIGSMAVKSALAMMKFRAGRSIASAALVADAWNDSVDILAAGAALVALGLTLFDPTQFLDADHYGGFAVGIVVAVTGLRVVRDTTLELTDAMPGGRIVEQIRRLAREVDGVAGVEKCYARKTGLQYHVDLHIEVDPLMTVARSHEIAHEVQMHVRRSLPAVADVLVHVEPAR